MASFSDTYRRPEILFVFFVNQTNRPLGGSVQDIWKDPFLGALNTETTVFPTLLYTATREIPTLIYLQLVKGTPFGGGTSP